MPVLLSAEHMHPDDLFLSVGTLEDRRSTHSIPSVEFILQHVAFLTHRASQLAHAHFLTIPRESNHLDRLLPYGFVGEVYPDAAEFILQISSLQLNNCVIQSNQLIRTTLGGP